MGSIIDSITRRIQTPAGNRTEDSPLWSSYARSSFPALDRRHLRDGRLFAERDDMIKALLFPADAAIAELGVAFGDFSLFLINQIKPRTFAAFDLFEMHNEALASTAALV